MLKKCEVAQVKTIDKLKQTLDTHSIILNGGKNEKSKITPRATKRKIEKTKNKIVKLQTYIQSNQYLSAN